MTIRITQLDDLEDARELHALAFPEDLWPGDDHTYWVARDGKTLLGMASAVHRPDEKYVYLSRCAVVQSAQGRGVGRRLIRARVKWAVAEGAAEAITYVSLKNYPSLLNLLKCGFQLYEPDEPYVGQNWHYLRKSL